MTPDQIRLRIHDILDAHDAALSAIRVAHGAMGLASKAHDDALVSAIEANRAALRLLDEMREEGR
jgi:hypothetical protein